MDVLDKRKRFIIYKVHSVKHKFNYKWSSEFQKGRKGSDNDEDKPCDFNISVRNWQEVEFTNSTIQIKKIRTLMGCNQSVILNDIRVLMKEFTQSADCNIVQTKFD